MSACDETATIVPVCRIILRLAHLSSMFRRMLVFEHLSGCAGRSLAFASSRLDEYGYSVRSHPNVRQGRVVRSCTVATQGHFCVDQTSLAEVSERDYRSWEVSERDYRS